ncbi:MAG: hypothetical protein HY211_06975 [Candidatus Omnitrophica bacterium]|nr:hypothetical protein [Candidatus Omnitrophota bacterium]
MRVFLLIGIGVIGLGLAPAAMAQPAKVTEEIVRALQSEKGCCTNSKEKEILNTALEEVVPAIQAEPNGLEAHIVGATVDAIHQGQPEEAIVQCASQEGGCCSKHHDLTQVAGYERPEIERPEREVHDHSDHDHGHSEEHEHAEHEHETEKS